MIDLLRYPFMLRALLAALLTGLMAPAIGTYIVQRRLSLLGDGLGHVAIAGVGLAVMTGTAPTPVAVVVAVLVADAALVLDDVLLGVSPRDLPVARALVAPPRAVVAAIASDLVERRTRASHGR